MSRYFPKIWANMVLDYQQLFHRIGIQGNTLSFRSFLATGKLVDAFDLIKQPGKQNQLIEKM